MKRKNWENILSNAILESTNTKFVWGESDCIMWTTSIIEKYTGVDLASELRGKYSTEKEALKLLKEKNLYTRTVEKLGEPMKNINFIKRGDLVLSIKDEMGICIGNKIAFLTKEDGTTFHPISVCKYAWSIK